jgi:hypothetical protein
MNIANLKSDLKAFLKGFVAAFNLAGNTFETPDYSTGMPWKPKPIN